MKYTFFTFLLLFTNLFLSAQTLQESIFTNGDKLHVELHNESTYYHTIQVKKGFTVYALSKAFNVSADKIYTFNNLEIGAPISLDQNLNIPIEDRILYKGTSLNAIKIGHYIPVFYKTKPKDNLFRISRIYFHQPMEDIIERNKLQNNNLALGQNILIGWLPLDGKQQSPTQTIEEDEINEEFPEPSIGENLDDISVSYTQNLEITEELIDTSDSLNMPLGFNPTLLGTISFTEDMSTIKKSSVALWDKTLSDKGAIFALHDKALINSYINLFNPNTKRSVRVKVIGRIPYGTYTKDVNLVISPTVAKQLGGLDRRFKVEIEYLIRK